MLFALNLTAIGLGLAGGGLSATFVALVVGGGLTVFGVEGGADVGLVLGVVSGMLVAGFVAGKLSLHSHRFHGSVVGLLFAGLLIMLAGFGEAQTSILMVLWLALLSVVIGGIGGWWGGYKRISAQ